MQSNDMKLILTLIAGTASNLSSNFFGPFLENFFLSSKQTTIPVVLNSEWAL